MRSELTVKEFFILLRRGWVWILSGAFLGCVLAFLYVFLAVPHYKARMIVSPANPMSGAEVSSLLGGENLFALRYVMQRVGVMNSSNFLRFENIYDGAKVAAVLLEREDIRKGLSKDHSFTWEGNKERWNAARFAAYVKRRVRIDPVGATSLREMSYYHADPEFAVYFLTVLHGVSDTLIRRDIRLDSEERIRYLKKTIADTHNPEHRRTLTRLLMEQERMKMLVSIDQPYAAAIIEPSAVSYKPEWPDRRLAFVVMVLLGAVIGLGLYSLAHD